MMSEFIKNKIKECDRENTVYIHPISSEEKIAQYISAFANGEGGVLIFGVADDGKTLTVKKFPFSLNEKKIRALLDGKVEMEINDFEFNNVKLTYLSVNVCSDLILADEIAYGFDKSRNLFQLTEKRVFLSYCHKDKDIADIVENSVIKDPRERIKITRDINKLNYKDSLDEYMRTIKEHDFSISIISDSYLKSKPCMYEISELMRDRDYFNKLLFIIIGDNDVKYYNEKVENIKANVYSLERYSYITYWEKEKEKVDKMIAQIINPALTSEIATASKQIEVITLNIGEFLTKLSDGLGVSLSKMIESDFSEFRSIILDRT